MKVIFSLLLTLSLASSAQADELQTLLFGDQPQAFLSVDSNGELDINMDELDPTDPRTEEMLQMLEDQGYLERAGQDSPVQFETIGGCVNRLYTLVDISEQRIYIYENCSNEPTYVWKTTTGSSKKPTPLDWLDGRHPVRYGSRENESSKYPDAGCQGADGGGHQGNMAYAVYYSGSYAIHGTCAEANLGKRGSHGCMRVATKNAKIYQALVKKYEAQYGNASVTINIQK